MNGKQRLRAQPSGLVALRLAFRALFPRSRSPFEIFLGSTSASRDVDQEMSKFYVHGQAEALSYVLSSVVGDQVANIFMQQNPRGTPSMLSSLTTWTGGGVTSRLERTTARLGAAQSSNREEELHLEAAQQQRERHRAEVRAVQSRFWPSCSSVDLGWLGASLSISDLPVVHSGRFCLAWSKSKRSCNAV